MRRKQLPGLSVGGGWKNPIRETVELWELAYIVEAPIELVAEVFEVVGTPPCVDIRSANRTLLELAACGFTDWRETSLFGELIAGQRHIDRGGQVWLAVDGRPFKASLEDARTTSPVDAVELDLEQLRRCREKRRRTGR